MTTESENALANIATRLKQTIARLVYFTLGTADFTQAQMRDFLTPNLTPYVERGEEVVDRGRERLDAAADRSKQAVTDTRKMVDSTVGSYAEATLKAFNLPTRSDIDLLARQLDTLERQIDQLEMLFAAPPRPQDPDISATMDRIRRHARDRTAVPVA